MMKRKRLHFEAKRPQFVLRIPFRGNRFAEATPLKIHHGFYRAFSPEVTAAILVFQNNDKSAMLVFQTNRPLASLKNSHFQNEAKCRNLVSLVKIRFICMRMKNQFCPNGFTHSLALKQRLGELRKLSILGVELFSYVNAFFCSNTAWK